MTAFGASSLDFRLRFWISDPANGLTNVRGQVLMALWDAFKERRISNPLSASGDHHEDAGGDQRPREHRSWPDAADRRSRMPSLLIVREGRKSRCARQSCEAVALKWSRRLRRAGPSQAPPHVKVARACPDEPSPERPHSRDDIQNEVGTSAPSASITIRFVEPGVLPVRITVRRRSGLPALFLYCR